MTLSHKNFYSVSVWNKTQLVRYVEREIDFSDASATIDLTVDLPRSNPPYLVWPSLTCFNNATLRFEAAKNEFLQTSNDIGARKYDSPEHPLVTERSAVWGEVRVPAGATEAIGATRLTGRHFFIEEGMASDGSINRSEGQKLGELRAYQPSVDPGTDDWLFRSWWHVDGRGWDLNHQFTGRQGSYALKAQLDSPFPVETVWKAGASTWAFTPRMKEYGFQYPFADVGIEDLPFGRDQDGDFNRQGEASH